VCPYELYKTGLAFYLNALMVGFVLVNILIFEKSGGRVDFGMGCNRAPSRVQQLQVLTTIFFLFKSFI